MQISQVSSDLRESTFSMTSAKTAFFFSPLEIDFSVTLFRPLGKCYLLKGPSLTTLPKLLLCHSLAHNLEKAMAPHSSALAWTIPWTEEPGRLQSMGSLRVGHDLVIFTFTFRFHALEKEMATHSSVLAWRILGMAEPGGLPSTGSQGVGHDWSNIAAAAAHNLLNCFLSLITT